nr:NSP3 protein [Rotavirus J]
MAELIYDTLRSVVRNLYGDNEDSASFVRTFQLAMKDSGLEENVDNWRKCFYKKRIPKEMTSSTLSIQIQNLEREIIKIRTEGFCAGYDRKARTLNAFEIGKSKQGHTILIPSTHLSEIILQNTFNENLKLSPIPSEALERASIENNKLKQEIDELKATITNLSKQISEQEDSRLELMATQSVLNHQKKLTKRMQDQRDEAQYIIQGLCNRFGLQCFIDNRGVAFTEPDNKGKRKGRKNRRIPIYDYTFGDFDRPIEEDYVKDLTTEGIEPNPGPTAERLFCALFSVIASIVIIERILMYDFDNPDVRFMAPLIIFFTKIYFTFLLIVSIWI